MTLASKAVLLFHLARSSTFKRVRLLHFACMSTVLDNMLFVYFPILPKNKFLFQKVNFYLKKKRKYGTEKKYIYVAGLTRSWALKNIREEIFNGYIQLEFLKILKIIFKL